MGKILPFEKVTIKGKVLENSIKLGAGKVKHCSFLEVLEEAKVISDIPTKYETCRIIEMECMMVSIVSIVSIANVVSIVRTSIVVLGREKLYYPLRKPYCELILSDLTDREERTLRDALLENAKKAIRIRFEPGSLFLEEDGILRVSLSLSDIKELAIFEKPDSTW